MKRFPFFTYIIMCVLITIVFSNVAFTYNIPEGFSEIKSEPGVVLYQNNNHYVQVVNLKEGASIKLMHGPIANEGQGEGVYGGDNPGFTLQTLEQIWSNFSSSYSNAFSVTNGQFFSTNSNPSPLAFPLKVNGNIVSDGYGIDEYVNQKLMIELWDSYADIRQLTEENLYGSSASDILAGLSEYADKGLNTDNKRTFAGIIDDDMDGSFETVLIFNSTVATQYAAAQILRDFGSTKIIMFDGGGSTQMICQGTNYILSSRLIPQSIGILAAPSTEFYLLSGTLTNADGDPVPGWVYASETTGANLGNQVYTSNGTYEMALFPGTYRVYARVNYSYPSGSYYVSTPSQTITISANATLNIQVPWYELYHLTGKVSDTNGVGLANISVQAHDSSGTCQSYTTTDNSGNYDALLIGGTYSLYFRPPQNSIFLEKRVNNVPIYSDTTQNISLNSSEHRLSGTLTYADGSSAQGYVYASEVSGTAYRNVWSSDGTYQMALAPSNYRVYAQAYTSYPPGYTWITTPYQTVTVSGDINHNIDVPSHDLYHLTGKVTDINDIIQSNVRINAYDSSGFCYGYTTTAADGSYELMLIPGTYRLRISAPPATYPPFEIKKLTIAGDSVRNIRLSLEYTLLEEALALLPDDLDVALDVFDIIDQADALNYDISVQGAKGLLQIILNWAGSEMRVTLYEPNGSVYGEYQSTEPPINVEIPNPTEGTWKCEVTAIDVPHDNYPFALVAGISPNESPVADANGPYSGALDSPITFDASDSYDPDGNIVSYEWDWGSDGNFDESTDSASITHTWNEAYSGTIVLRVKDNEGATSTDSAYVEVDAGSLTAKIDINPDVLNPKSKGNWVTSYIELPGGYAAENIDVSTVILEGAIPAESSPTQVGDHDDDGIPDLMVKFDRQTLIGYLVGATGEVTLMLTGDVDGKPFEGSDTIIVIGKEKE